MERDAAHGLALQRVLFLQPAQHLPGDRLALAVGVGGQHQPVRLAQRRRDPAHGLRRAAARPVDHREVARGIDRAVLRRQVAHMAPGGEHLVAFAETAPDGLRLGRRLDDHHLHGVSRETCRTVGRDPDTRASPRAGRGGAAGKRPRSVRRALVHVPSGGRAGRVPSPGPTPLELRARQ